MEKFENFWKKNIINKVIVIIAGLFIIGMLGTNFSEDATTDYNIKSNEVKINASDQTKVENIVEICDGVNIIKDYELDGIKYILYKYYPAEEETFHYETEVTYEKKIVGYCTLCNDGTRSPSCSTGSGTCSHHGGVAEWNAPIYKEVAHEEKTKVIDSPAKDERYETIIKE